jgi:hypothetical protein
MVVIEEDTNMIREEGIEIKWHSIGKACLRLDIAIGIGFWFFHFLIKSLSSTF